MSTVELSPQVVARFEAEAARRGVSVADLLATLADDLPNLDRDAGRRPGFVGLGASSSGRTAREAGRSSLDSMTDREVITAEDLDRMTPDQRAAAVRASIATDWDQVPAEVRARVEATAATLACQVDHRTVG